MTCCRQGKWETCRERRVERTSGWSKNRNVSPWRIRSVAPGISLPSRRDSGHLAIESAGVKENTNKASRLGRGANTDNHHQYGQLREPNSSVLI